MNSAYRAAHDEKSAEGHHQAEEGGCEVTVFDFDER